MGSDYWEDCVAEAFDDAKIEATADQIQTVAGWFESGHENHGMAHGHDVASANFSAGQRSEIESLKAELHAEKSKTLCDECRGTGQTVSHGPVHSAHSDCWKCRGAGRQ